MVIPPSLATVQRLVTADLQRFEDALTRSFSIDSVTLGAVMDYLLTAKGKRLRPTLVFLSARLFGAPLDTTMRTALFVELLHTATLIHDDVVDGSDERRGRPAVHVRWDTPTAVLAGDFLLARAMELLANSDNLPILREMLDTARSMSEGELMQREEGSRQKTEDSRYLEVIKRKTAMLFKACCVGGALSVGASERQAMLIGTFGLNLGMTFQMRDDLLDEDDPATTKEAEAWLPGYLEKTMAALEALEADTTGLSVEVLESLRALALFCAERTH